MSKPELKAEDLLKLEDELFKYVSQIMSLSPAEALVILALVSGRIIREQGKDYTSKVKSLISISDLFTKSALNLNLDFPKNLD